MNSYYSYFKFIGASIVILPFNFDTILGSDGQTGTETSSGVVGDDANAETPIDPDRYSPFFYLWILCSIASSLYAYTWDIKMDWGLLDRYLRI